VGTPQYRKNKKKTEKRTEVDEDGSVQQLISSARVSRTSAHTSVRKFSSNWIISDGRIFTVIRLCFRFGRQ
jgi:hypothetical protein